MTRLQNIKQLAGQRFGRLTVVSLAALKRVRWNCVCDCGSVTVVLADSLSAGRTTSCGCFRKQDAVRRATTHGMSRSREHKAWIDMKARCSPHWKEKQYYFERGIAVCAEWINDFAAFYEHVGQCPRGLSLDRIDNDKGYFPGNVRWATAFEQTHNRRRTSRWTKK